MNTLPNLANKKPVYTLKLPTTGETVEYSPYTNEDEKNIIIASQENDYKTIMSTLESVIKRCSNVTPTTIIDFTYLMLHIRAKSSGATYDSIIKECECGHKKIDIHLDNLLDHIEIKNQENLKDTYTLYDNIALRLSPTKLDFLKNVKIDQDNKLESIYEQENSIIFHSTDYVVNDKEIIKGFTYDVFHENIIKHITRVQKNEINKKIGNMIRSVLKIKYVCPGCEKEFEKEVNDFLFLN